MLATFFWSWWHYYFAPHGQPWWAGAVWGNIFALLPMMLIAGLGFWWHHTVLARAHRLHSRHLAAIIDLLDPRTDGGIAVVLDRLDPLTPGGIRAIVDRLDQLEGGGESERK